MKIKSLIFDMDGVLWKDSQPIVNLKEIFIKIKQANINYAFATNKSTNTPESYQKKFAKFGVSVNTNQVITSGTNLASILQEKFPQGGPLYIVGETGLYEILDRFGFFHQERDVLAVVGGLDRKITYKKLSGAVININKGVPFYFTNGDPSYPSPEGDIPGAGAIKAAIETPAGIKPITPGTPEPFMFQNALKLLKSRPEETLVIGDRLDTDILGGNRAGCQTALMLSGVTSKATMASSDIKPDYVFENVEQTINTLIESSWDLDK